MNGERSRLLRVEDDDGRPP